MTEILVLTYLVLNEILKFSASFHVGSLKFKLPFFVDCFYNVVGLSTFVCLFFSDKIGWDTQSVRNKVRSVFVIHFSNYRKFINVQIV